MGEPRQFPAVGIAQHSHHRLAVKRRILLPRLFGVAIDPLVEDGLAGAIDAAVGHQYEMIVPRLLRLLPDAERLPGDGVLRPGERGAGHQQHFPVGLGGEFVAALRVGLGLRFFNEAGGISLWLAHQQINGGSGQRFARGYINHVSGERLCVPMIAALGHQRQPAHPHQSRTDHVVLLAKIGSVAGEHPVAARREVLGHRDIVAAGLIVVRGGHVDAEGPQRSLLEQRLPVGLIEPFPLRLASPGPSQPVGRDNPQMHLREIGIAHPDHRPRLAPGALRFQRQALGLNLRQQIFAELRASALWMGGHRGSGQRMGPHQSFGIPLAAFQIGQMGAGKCGRFMVGRPGEKGLQSRCLAVALCRGRVAGGQGLRRPEDALKIGGQKCSAVGIGGMGAEQVLMELERFQERRIGVGNGRISGRIPGTKVLGRAQCGRFRGKLKQILRISQSPFPRGGKGEGIVDEHIPQRWPVGIAHRAGREQRRPLCHGQFLGGSGGGQRRGEAGADLGYDLRQIPAGDAGKIGLRCGSRSGGALGKAPAIGLKKSPRPVGLDRLEHGLGFGWRCGDGRREAHQPLGVVFGAVACFGEDARGDRPGGLGPGLVGHGTLFDAPQSLQRRLRFSLLERLVHALPGGAAGAGDLVCCESRVHHEEESPKEQGEGKCAGHEAAQRQWGKKAHGNPVWAKESREAATHSGGLGSSPAEIVSYAG